MWRIYATERHWYYVNVFYAAVAEKETLGQVFRTEGNSFSATSKMYGSFEAIK